MLTQSIQLITTQTNPIDERNTKNKENFNRNDKGSYAAVVSRKTLTLTETKTSIK